MSIPPNTVVDAVVDGLDIVQDAWIATRIVARKKSVIRDRCEQLICKRKQPEMIHLALCPRPDSSSYPGACALNDAVAAV